MTLKTPCLFYFRSKFNFMKETTSLKASHRLPKRNIRVRMVNCGWNIRVCMEIKKWHCSRSMNGLFAKWILLNIQPYHFFSSWRVWTRLSEFWYICPTVSVIIRDKVGNFGQFDDRTLFENESNLHTKVAFTHNISRWTHNLWPVVSIPAVQWSTHSVFSVLAGQKVEIW